MSLAYCWTYSLYPDSTITVWPSEDPFVWITSRAVGGRVPLYQQLDCTRRRQTTASQRRSTSRPSSPLACEGEATAVITESPMPVTRGRARSAAGLSLPARRGSPARPGGGHLPRGGGGSAGPRARRGGGGAGGGTGAPPMLYQGGALWTQRPPTMVATTSIVSSSSSGHANG